MIFKNNSQIKDITIESLQKITGMLFRRAAFNNFAVFHLIDLR